jgi:acetyl-CoA carboxylase biotin carboxyl carrier protein
LVQLIEDMVELMEQRGLVELEVEREGLRLRLRKAHADVAPSAGPASAAPPASAPSEERPRAAIKAPMVGTFYRAPASDAAPFVDVGQEVAAGQVVCIIEAMKLMNEITAEVAGRIAEVLVDNGAPVEFGQPLFLVEPR